MQNIVYKSLLGTFAAIAMVGCKPDQKAPTPTAGSLDVSKYVSIGNSITAGYADNALYYDGQMVSYANLIAGQFKLVGGGEFKIPLLPMSSIGVGSAKNSKLTLGYKKDCTGITGLSPVGTIGDTMVFYGSVAAQGPFNNMGVPGAKMITAQFRGYGNPSNGPGLFNPFFTRMLAPSEYQTASMITKAVAQRPTFFSLFLGNNDVLGYASSGGAADFISTSALFNASVDQIVDTVMAYGTKQGVIANVPDVTNLPFFTTVPGNALVLDQTKAAQLTGYYALMFPSAGITFSAGPNYFVIKDGSVIRKMTANEFVLLTIPQDSIKCANWGSLKPITTQFILTETEIANIQTAVSAYNSKLKAVADAKGLAYVDVNAFMAQAKKGVVYDGVTTSATFVSGGAFSLDGVHLTPKGNALLANEFLKAINSKYGSTIPLINAGEYRGVVFPN